MLNHPCLLQDLILNDYKKTLIIQVVQEFFYFENVT